MSEFIQNNWFWIVVFGFFIWMHASGMGCEGTEDIGMAVGMRKRSAKRVADINIEWKLLNIYDEPEAANCAA